MLKIREDVNMKILEEYGFKYFIRENGTCGYTIKTIYGYYNILEKDNDNFIKIWERRLPTNIDLDLLYDLIKANLVVKVEE